MKKTTLSILIFAFITLFFVACSSVNESEVEYSFAVETGENGSAFASTNTSDPLNRGKAKVGESVTLKAVPNEGYVFARWVVMNGGVTLNETINSATFTMPANNVSIRAEFELDLQSSKYTVYVAGRVHSEDNLSHSLSVWINGEEPVLYSGVSALFESKIYVSDNKVYVAGDDYDHGNSKRLACLWVDGVKQILPSEMQAYPTSVFVSKGKVYVSGREYDRRYYEGPATERQLDLATLWVDGVKQNLSWKDGIGLCAEDVFVADDKVYVLGVTISSGVYDKNRKLVIWTDGVPATLDTGEFSLGGFWHSLYVSEGKTYVASAVQVTHNSFPHPNKACLWVDGEMTLLSPDSFDSDTSSLCVWNGKVYVAGHDNSTGSKQEACLWVDGVKSILPTPETTLYSYTSGISVVDGKVFVSGYIESTTKSSIPCLWIDGVFHILPSVEKGDADDIMVVAN